MLDLRNDFRLKSIADLEKLSLKLNANTRSPLTAELLQELIRKIHTVKGTAQAFGFENAAEIAHSIEDLIGNYESRSETDRLRISASVHELTDAISREAEHDQHLGDLTAESVERTTSRVVVFISNIPKRDFLRFSEHEERRLVRGSIEGQICSIQTTFASSSVFNELAEFRSRAASLCEIVASIPGDNALGNGGVTFRNYFVTDSVSSVLNDLAGEYDSTVKVHTLPQESQNVLTAVVGRLGLHSAEICRQLKKNAQIVVFTNRFDLPLEKTCLLFEILLHLIRNSIAHPPCNSIEIEIDIELTAVGLWLSVSDDGGGVDFESVYEVAVSKGHIPQLYAPNRHDLENLIFLPGFSTSRETTSVAGRGFGLDAVKRAVTDVNGTITLSTDFNEGTAFDIFLPND